MQHVIGFIMLAAVFVGTRYIIGWKMKRAAEWIVADMKRQGAIAPEKAIVLPYVRPDWLKFGLRDYRRKTVMSMIQAGLVVPTEEGKYYLNENFMAGKEVAKSETA